MRPTKSFLIRKISRVFTYLLIYKYLLREHWDRFWLWKLSSFFISCRYSIPKFFLDIPKYHIDQKVKKNWTQKTRLSSPTKFFYQLCSPLDFLLLMASFWNINSTSRLLTLIYLEPCISLLLFFRYLANKFVLRHEDFRIHWATPECFYVLNTMTWIWKDFLMDGEI